LEVLLTDIRATAVCALLSLGVIGACSGKPADPAASSQAPGAVSAAAATPGAAAAGAIPAAGQAVQTATGTVLETFDAATYTYVRVKAESGELWAATSTFKVAVGDRVMVPLEMPMENFHSQTLKRDFPLIYFTSRIGREGDPAPAMPAMASAHAPMGGAAPSAGPMSAANAAQVIEPIAPAPGGSTVVNVWTNRKSLAGKTVTVRGKVVKFNGGIMGRNWIHIQDGTGVAADGTNDLLVTSDAAAKVGDVITVTGTVGVDKDFTAGYAYAVLIEGATIVVK
jgi:hypothetical protein